MSRRPRRPRSDRPCTAHRSPLEASTFAASIVVDDVQATVRLTGELDLATLPYLVAAVGGAMTAGARIVVVNLAGATFVDLTTLQRIVALSRHAADHGILVAVEDPSPAVVEVLTLTGLDAELTIRARR